MFVFKINSPFEGERVDPTAGNLPSVLSYSVDVWSAARIELQNYPVLNYFVKVSVSTSLFISLLLDVSKQKTRLVCPPCIAGLGTLYLLTWQTPNREGLNPPQPVVYLLVERHNWCLFCLWASHIPSKCNVQILLQDSEVKGCEVEMHHFQTGKNHLQRMLPWIDTTPWGRAVTKKSERKCSQNWYLKWWFWPTLH